MRIRVHYTWIPVFFLLTAIVATQYPEDFVLWQRIALGIAVSLLLLGAVTVRELLLSLAAFHKEDPFKRLTLFVFGGVYQESRHRINTSHLSLLYLARYLSNLVIAVIFYGLYATFINTSHIMMAEVAQWLAYTCFLIFLVHFLPAFPLDGGNILRLLLWKSTGDYYKATHTASLIGLAAGLFFIFAGVLMLILTRLWAISIVIITLGWALQSAARQTRNQIKALRALQGVKAEDIMTREYPVMPRQINLEQVIRDQILAKGSRYVMVTDESELKGILTVDQIEAVPGKRWNNTTLGDVMIPIEKIVTAHPQQAGDVLFDEMLRRRFDYIPVLEDRKLIGVVTRYALADSAKIRSGFGI